MLTAIPNGTATVPYSPRAAYNIIVCFMANVIILWVKKASKMDNDKHIIQIVDVLTKKVMYQRNRRLFTLQIWFSFDEIKAR